MFLKGFYCIGTLTAHLSGGAGTSFLSSHTWNPDMTPVLIGTWTINLGWLVVTQVYPDSESHCSIRNRWLILPPPEHRPNAFFGGGENPGKSQPKKERATSEKVSPRSFRCFRSNFFGSQNSVKPFIQGGGFEWSCVRSNKGFRQLHAFGRSRCHLLRSQGEDLA